MDASSYFQSGQIVSLDYDHKNLYTEVIQVVPAREMCWVRPLLMVNLTYNPPLVTDLRDASDIFWPLNLFRPALDTEVISLLGEILSKEPKAESPSVAQQQLHQFIQQIWQAYQSSKEL
ncbi:MAG TPA: hypothetical protein VK203_01210 [Nostocaceae cyanobacterium]|nr:hypothetical protein [Nostocaceae cyanobacterium]